MSKRAIRRLLTVGIGVMAMLAGLSACTKDCGHENAAAGADTATCTSAGTITYICPDCGESWMEASEALGHAWDAGEISRGTLCTEGGTITYTCTREGCGATRTEELPADHEGHALDEGTVTKAATCSAAGEKLYRCTNEGCAYSKTEVIPATGVHVLDEGTVTKAATCSAVGEKLYRCTNEGCSFSKTEVVPATGEHVLDKGTVTRQATCTAAGERVYRCVNEGCSYSETQPIAARGHQLDSGTVTVAPTCMKEGATTYRCTRMGCGYTETKSVDALGHDWNEGVTDGAVFCTQAYSVVYTCTRMGCGEKKTETVEAKYEEHELAESTVVTAATCCAAGESIFRCTHDGCTYSETRQVPATGEHILGEGEVVKNATCGETGEMKYACLTEGCTYTESKPISPTGGHSYTLFAEQSIAATCETAGKEVYLCSVCGASYEKEIASLGHAWNTTAVCSDKICTREGCTAKEAATAQHSYPEEPSERVDATCMAAGYERYRCSVCGAAYEDVLPQLAHRMELSNETRPGSNACEVLLVYVCAFDGCGHEETEQVYQHTYVTQIETVATCCENGTKHEVCSACGAEKENSTETYSDENAHEWDAGVTANGVTTFTCVLDKTHTKTAIVAADTSATVTQDVLAQTDEVSLKGALIAMDEKAVEGLDQNTNYTLAAEVVSGDKVPGAEEDEQVYSITLSDGTQNVTQFDGTVTVTLPYMLQPGDDINAIHIVYIDDKGEPTEIECTYSNGYVTFRTTHFSYYTVRQYTAAQMCEKYEHRDEGVRGQAATCTKDGYSVTYCTRCGEVLEEKVLPATGHKLGAPEVVDATCTQAGSFTYRCENEGCEYMRTTTAPALGHDWNDPVETSATCIQNGSRTRICEMCGTEETETIPALGHTLGEPVLIPATCTESGREVRSCTNPGCTYSETNVLQALGHDYRASATPATCTEDGITVYTCAVCGDQYAGEIIPAKGHSWNIPEPTCGEGQICTVCGAAGAPATGAHKIEDGFCTVCGQGCVHDYAAGTSVAPTCTENGYTPYICTVCGAVEKRDPVPATEHERTVEEIVAETNVTHIDGSTGIFWYIYQHCICGQSRSYLLYSDHCRFMSSGWDEERGCEVMYCENGCGVSVIFGSQTTYKDEDGCVADVVVQLGAYLNGKLIGEREIIAQEMIHRDLVSTGVLLAGAETCEDGVVITQNCNACGYFGQETLYGHFDLQEVVFKTETAHGSFKLFHSYCPCGEVDNLLFWDTDCNFRNEWDAEKQCSVYTCTIEGCGLWFEEYYGDVYADENSCAGYTEQIVKVYRGEELLQEIVVRSAEDTMHRSFKEIGCELKDGAESCEDGVVVTFCCEACGEIWTEERNFHSHATLLGSELAPGSTSCTTGRLDTYYCEVCDNTWTQVSYDHLDGVAVSVELAPGAESCEDGVITTYQCSLCGGTWQQTEYFHQTIIEEMFVTQTSHGTFVVEHRYCACGQNDWVDFFAGDCLLEYGYDNEKGCSVYICTVEGCGIRVESYYDFVSSDNECVGHDVEHIIVYRNEEVLYEETLESAERVNHRGQQIVSTELLPGSETCEDGVISIYRCDVCGETWTEEYDYHRSSSPVSAELLPGSESCEDGVEIVWYCDVCGETWTETAYYHVWVEQVIFETTVEHGGVSSEFKLVQNGCPCGAEEGYIGIDSGGCDFMAHWDDERECDVFICSCGVSYEIYSTFVYESEGSCIGRRQQRYVVYRDGVQVAEAESESEGQNHERAITVGIRLEDGAVTCEDGVIFTYECERCGEQWEGDGAGHFTYSEVVYRVPSDHGDHIETELVVTLNHCPCGRISNLSFEDSDCYFDDHVFAQEGEFEVNCAVTGCPIRYVRTATFTAEQVCFGIWSYRYDFYDGDTLLYSVTTQEEGFNHQIEVTDVDDHPEDGIEVGDRYTRTHTEDCLNEDCPYCLIDIITYYHTEGADMRVESIRRHTLEDGYYWEEVAIYDPDNYFRPKETVVSDTDETGEFAERFTETYEYDGCVATVTRVFADGATDTYTEEIHAFGDHIAPTCTQHGGKTCLLCNEPMSWGDFDPPGHIYENGVCIRCGLENEQSSDGPVWAEDLYHKDYAGSDYVYREEGTVLIGVRCADRAYSLDNLIVNLIAVGLTEEAQLALGDISVSLPEAVLTENIFSASYEFESESGIVRIDATALSETFAALAESTGLAADSFGIQVSFVPIDMGDTGYECSLTLEYEDVLNVLG